MMRPMVSLEPPAEKGTTSVNGRVGQSSAWARPGRVHRSAAITLMIAAAVVANAPNRREGHLAEFCRSAAKRFLPDGRSWLALSQSRPTMTASSPARQRGPRGSTREGHPSDREAEKREPARIANGRGLGNPPSKENATTEGLRSGR